MYRHVLSAGQCHAIRVRAGTTVTCTHGLLWLTFEPDARRVPSADQLASPRSAYVAPATGCIYVSPVHKCGDAAFEVVPAPRSDTVWRRPFPALRRLLAAVGVPS